MWLRENQVDLLKYLPPFLQKDLNFRAVTQTENAEHERIRLLLKDVFAQFFVETATWGLSIYEKILDLQPKPTDSIEQRRLRILARLQFTQTSTVKFMAELVKKYAQQNTDVTIIEVNSDYSFKIKVRGGSILHIEDLVEAVELYKPAHLGWLLSREVQITNKIFIGFAIRKGRKHTIKPLKAYSFDGVQAQPYYGCFIRISRNTSIKAGE